MNVSRYRRGESPTLTGATGITRGRATTLAVEVRDRLYFNRRKNTISAIRRHRVPSREPFDGFGQQ